jgi:cytochrome bd ubiquinol oxidase subunit I
LSLIGYVAVYAVIYAFGLSYIYRLLREGPAGDAANFGPVTPGRPIAVALQESRQ